MMVTQTPRDRWLLERLTALDCADIPTFLERYTLKSYRLDQLYRAATKELLPDPASVTVLPQALRDGLQDAGLRFSLVTPTLVQHSRDGQTTKALFRLADGAEVESVLMEHYGERRTLCISSQAGCAFACAFCSTGQSGFGRHLTANEIFDQARFFAAELAQRERRLTNIVFMGMGEPFHNYDAVMGAVALLNDPQGLGLGHRHITISTVGVVPQIDRFADEALQVNLAISLHAPNDALRSQIMPVNRKYPVAELMAACDRYREKTNRKIFYEYLMLDNFNDREETAHELAKLMQRRLAHVNLIPYNPTPDAPYRGSDGATITAFRAVLEAAGVPVTVRHPMGRDIAAACGQLRATAVSQRR